jgi:hypothetical protein
VVLGTEVELGQRNSFAKLIQTARVDAAVVLKDALVGISENDDSATSGQLLDKSPLSVVGVLKLIKNDDRVPIRKECANTCGALNEVRGA